MLRSVMPRGPRLDAPGVLHHVMVRGIDRQVIFRDDPDRTDFLARLATAVKVGGLAVYAWALLPNHAHLLVRTGPRSLARCMRALLTGYAGVFNRRHKRIGHLFQNRYKSIVVEEEPYLLELVRYLHLNPLRAAVVTDVHALARYPWTGHSALLGSFSRPWQDTATVLTQFGPDLRRARRAYQRFVITGATQGQRPELQGGGLRRSEGGWAAVQALRQGREAYLADERILGSSTFVEGIRQELASRTTAPAARPSLETLVTRACRAVGVSPTQLQGSGRRRNVVQAREGLAYLWVEVLGRNGRLLATRLGLKPPAICKAAHRGAADATRWRELIVKIQRETKDTTSPCPSG